MRTISLIIIHCSAVGPMQTSSAEQIDQWHKQRGWKGIGYHYVIRRDGTIEMGRPEDQVGAHCKNHNSHSIGICYEGGLALRSSGSNETSEFRNFETRGARTSEFRKLDTSEKNDHGLHRITAENRVARTSESQNLENSESRDPRESQHENFEVTNFRVSEIPSTAEVPRFRVSEIPNDSEVTNLRSVEFPNSAEVPNFRVSELSPSDTRTPAQKSSLLTLLTLLKKKYPHAIILGHHDLDPTKSCPCFDAAHEYAEL